MTAKVTRITLLTLLALTLGACSPPAAGGTAFPAGLTVRPIEDIVSVALEVTNFANDGSATLPIRTSIPVACTIVCGKTPQFGAVSFDQDMSSGVHSDHSPLLSGLEPETSYYFRVQGIDASGVLYISETMTFATPPRVIGEVNNLASAARGAEIIGFSSAYGNAAPDATWGIASAFDDNPNTTWSSAGDGNNALVEVRLAKPARITAVSFHSRSMSDGSAITRSFSVSTDSGQVLGPFEVPDPNRPHEFALAFETQTLKFELVDTTGGNSGAVDIAVYGDFIE